MHSRSTLSAFIVALTVLANSVQAGADLAGSTLVPRNTSLDQIPSVDFHAESDLGVIPQMDSLDELPQEGLLRALHLVGGSVLGFLIFAAEAFRMRDGASDDLKERPPAVSTLDSTLSEGDTGFEKIAEFYEFVSKGDIAGSKENLWLSEVFSKWLQDKRSMSLGDETETESEISEQ